MACKAALRRFCSQTAGEFLKGIVEVRRLAEEPRKVSTASPAPIQNADLQGIYVVDISYHYRPQVNHYRPQM
jgi:hypothetical protein